MEVLLRPFSIVSTSLPPSSSIFADLSGLGEVEIFPVKPVIFSRNAFLAVLDVPYCPLVMYLPFDPSLVVGVIYPNHCPKSVSGYCGYSSGVSMFACLWMTISLML